MGPLTGAPASGSPRLVGPIRLADAGDCDLLAFDCGDGSINDWLWQRARRSDGDTSRAHVLLDEGRRVVAYLTLHAACVPLAAMPTARLRRNRPDPLPAVLIGRAGVTRGWQGQGIFGGMLKHAFGLIRATAENVAVSLVLVQPLDAEVAATYARLGFTPLHLKEAADAAAQPAMPPPMVLPLGSIG